MNEEYLRNYLALRASRLGWTHYDYTVRHFTVRPDGKVKIQANNQLFLLINADQGVRIESENGIYDTTNEDITELVEEHTGIIILINRFSVLKHARFLQGIPREAVGE